MNCEFHHVHLRSEDLEAAVAYYEKMFDGKVTERVLKSVAWKLSGWISEEKEFLSPRDLEALILNPLAGGRVGVCINSRFW